MKKTNIVIMALSMMAAWECTSEQSSIYMAVSADIKAEWTICLIE